MADDPSPVALSLVAAAAGACGPAPADAADRAGWVAEVGRLAVALFREAGSVQQELALLAEVTVIAGVLTAAEEHSGRGVIHLRPTIGDKADDPAADEVLRTGWLSEPKGAALFEQARALVGRPCRFGKFFEKAADGRKIRMVAWIEPTGRPAPLSPPPADSGVLVRRAADELGVSADVVRKVAANVLPPLPPGAVRTEAELAVLWEALVVAAKHR